MYICRTKRKYVPSLDSHSADSVYIPQEFPHERITRYSSTMRRVKEDFVSSSQRMKSTRTPVDESHYDHQKSNISKRDVQEAHIDRLHTPEIHHGAPVKAVTTSNSIINLHTPTPPSADINQVGLPIPPPPPIPPTHLLFHKNTASKSVHKPRHSSIRRSIRKYHWSDVNNNDSDTKTQTDVTDFEETMKSGGESVYF